MIENIFIFMGFFYFGFIIKDSIREYWRSHARSTRHSTAPLTQKTHWRDMDYYHLEALNELNKELLEDDEESRALAQYLKYNTKEDHERRKEGRSKLLSGSFNTLYAPGLQALQAGSIVRANDLSQLQAQQNQQQFMGQQLGWQYLGNNLSDQQQQLNQYNAGIANALGNPYTDYLLGVKRKKEPN